MRDLTLTMLPLILTLALTGTATAGDTISCGGHTFEASDERTVARDYRIDVAQVYDDGEEGGIYELTADDTLNQTWKMGSDGYTVVSRRTGKGVETLFCYTFSGTKHAAVTNETTYSTVHRVDETRFRVTLTVEKP